MQILFSSKNNNMKLKANIMLAKFTVKSVI